MKTIKTLLLLFSVFQIGICSAQDFKFIPKSQHLLGDEQIKTMDIMITPSVLLFNERGEILPMSQMELMANPDYKPLFYSDSVGKIKSVVFKRKSSKPIVIKKNPKANFEPGEKALDFIITDINNNTIKLSELKGKVVVLNFWFTKCPPCIQEMPELNALTEEFKNKDVMFLAISFNKKEIIEQFLETNTFKYTLAVNANDVIKMYNVNSFPTSIVINKKGEITHKDNGYRTNVKSVLSAAIKSSL